MARSMSVLRILARLDPRLWELVHPHVPILHQGLRTSRRFGDEVFLNPQPLPPRERLLLETVSAARAVAEAAIAAQFAGRDVREVLQEVGDDWCLTRPGTIPWPRHWPHPWPPGEAYPIAEEIDQVAQAAQAAAGLVFQSYAAGIQDERLSASFAELADRLEEAAVTDRQG
ncbi:hypothetical protein [Blastococcus deserti]|uniref:DUF4259 domain-containing protein n=1 Tax=Blastococcus deserti TaxID=2259033 RepID=A0ABW4X803_9ACTN